jgi:hypothetical protein
VTFEAPAIWELVLRAGLMPAHRHCADPRRLARAHAGSPVIVLPPTRLLDAALDPVDFRRTFDVLVAMARKQLGLDALPSAIVLFVNRDG